MRYEVFGGIFCAVAGAIVIAGIALNDSCSYQPAGTIVLIVGLVALVKAFYDTHSHRGT